MPWKNGGGETIEIAVSPPDASLDDFDWRISMAKVEKDGPFSSFPHIDRTLLILDGGGIVLDIAGFASLALSADSGPASFPADVPTQSRLPAGSVRDFNVMTRRGRFSHSVERFSGAERRQTLQAEGITIILACVPLMLNDGRETMALQPDDVAILEGRHSVDLEASSIAAVVTRITPAA